MLLKRSLSLVLALILLAGFSGCRKQSDDGSEYSVYYLDEVVEGNGNTAAQGGNKSDDGSITGSSSVDGSKTPANGEKLNFGGKTITVLREWGAYERGKYTVWDNWNNNIDRIEKEFNVNIVEKKWSVTLANEILAGVKPEGQLYQISSGTVYNYAQNGYLADFNNAIQTTGINMKSDIFNQFNVQLNNINGKQYTAGYGFARVPSVVLFNKTILKKANYDIYSLINEGNWTWEKMTEIAKKTTVKNSSGEITQYGIGLNTNALAALSLSNGSHLCYPDSSGKYEVMLSSAGTQAAIKQAYDWINVDRVSSYNWGKQVWTQLGTDFAAKKIVMLFGGHTEISQAYSSLNDDWGVAYIPKGPNASNYISVLQDEYSYVVPAAYADQTSDLLRLLNEMYQLPDNYSADDQFRDEWIRYFKDKDSYNMFKTLHDGSVKQVWDGSLKIGLGNSTTSFDAAVGRLYEGEIQPGTFADSYQGTFQTNVNDSYGDIKYTGSLK